MSAVPLSLVVFSAVQTNNMLFLFFSETVWLSVGVHRRVGHQKSTWTHHHRQAHTVRSKCGFPSQVCPLIQIFSPCICSSLHCFSFFCRELYGLCQMFPEAACKAMQSTIADVGHSMEEVLEVKGHAAFPALDMVWIIFCECHKKYSPGCIEICVFGLIYRPASILSSPSIFPLQFD